MELLTQARAIKAAAFQIANASSEQKNQLLSSIIDELKEHSDDILSANKQDIQTARMQGSRKP